MPAPSAAPVGATVSIFTASEVGVSALPRLSTEKNRTVAVADTVNGPVYRVDAVVGVLPFVV